MNEERIKVVGKVLILFGVLTCFLFAPLIQDLHTSEVSSDKDEDHQMSIGFIVASIGITIGLFGCVLIGCFPKRSAIYIGSVFRRRSSVMPGQLMQLAQVNHCWQQPRLCSVVSEAVQTYKATSTYSLSVLPQLFPVVLEAVQKYKDTYCSSPQLFPVVLEAVQTYNDTHSHSL